MADSGSATFRERLVSVYRRMRRGGESNPASAPQSSGNRHAREIEAEHVRLLYLQLPPALFATAVIAVLVVYVLWEQVSRPWLLSWFVALTLLTLGRLWLMQNYLASNPPAIEATRWGKHFVIGVGLSGLLWGVAGLFPFKQPSLVHEVFLGFVLAGLAAGAMSTLSSFRGAYQRLPGARGAAVRSAELLQQGDVYVAMSAMLVLFIAMMSMISARHYRSVSGVAPLRFDNVGPAG